MKKSIIDELLLLMLCSLAALLGPVILLNTNVKANFMIVGFIFSIICLLISYLVKFFENFILRRLSNSSRWLWGTAVGFIPFFSLVFERGGIRLLFEYHKPVALFNLSAIVVIITFLVLFLKIKGLTFKSATYKTGLSLVFPLFLIIQIFSKLNLGQQILLGNVAVIYFSLKLIFFRWYVEDPYEFGRGHIT